MVCCRIISVAALFVGPSAKPGPNLDANAPQCLLSSFQICLNEPLACQTNRKRPERGLETLNRSLFSAGFTLVSLESSWEFCLKTFSLSSGATLLRADMNGTYGLWLSGPSNSHFSFG